MESIVVSVAEWFTNKQNEKVYKVYVPTPNGEVGYFACPAKDLPKPGDKVEFVLGVDADGRITARKARA